MKILAFDTSHGNCTVTLLENSTVTEELTDHEPSRQSERLFTHIETVLKKHKLHYKDLNGIGVTTGPGSFTGIRIGLAAARGIRMVNKLPIIGISTLAAVAWQAKSRFPVCAVLDAKRNQLYVQSFNKKLEALNNPALITYEEIASHIPETHYILTGNGSALVKEILQHHPVTHEIINPDATSHATACAHLAAEILKNGNYPEKPDPLYIRAPDAKL